MLASLNCEVRDRRAVLFLAQTAEHDLTQASKYLDSLCAQEREWLDTALGNLVLLRAFLRSNQTREESERRRP
ncbi:MAG TPA: hypothetical protein VD994_05355 [Prosthecobacter sp.]|nr:hypothetical protein [Prosthecobacter sp.]